MEIDDIVGRWDLSNLPPNVRIGPGTSIETRASFDRFYSRRDPGLVIGANCMVYTWVGFSTEPEGVIEIGDDCVLVGGMFMCAEHITLGDRVVVSYDVTIADCDFHPMDPEVRMQDAIAIT